MRSMSARVVRWFTMAQRMTGSPPMVVHDGTAMPVSCMSRTSSRLTALSCVQRTPKHTILRATGAFSSNSGLCRTLCARC